MRSLKKTTALLAVASTLTLGLAACGSSDSTSDGGNASSSAPSAEASPVAVLKDLTGVQTSVKLDQGFVDALGTLKLTPGVTGGATLTDGSVNFPITSGNATYYDPASGVDPYVQGEISHDQSGLTLTAGEGTAQTQVELSNFVVDPGKSMLFGKVLVNGKPFPESGDQVELFILDGSTLQPLAVDKAAGTGTLQGTTVKLSKTAADALNMVFKVDALKEDLVIGVATITLKLPASS